MDVCAFLGNCGIKKWRVCLWVVLLGASALMPKTGYAHPSPNSLIFLDISPGHVVMETQIPLPELALVLGDDIQQSPEAMPVLYDADLRSYLMTHVRAYADRGRLWQIEITGMRMDKGTYADSNIPYWELVVQFVLHPYAGESTRKFSLEYDAVMHQVINHVAFVSVRSDWESGMLQGDPAKEVSVIGWDLGSNAIHPLEVNLDAGSWWQGMGHMVMLGVQHIKEGTDHLLFLLVLLLSAPLTPATRAWGGYGGLRYSVSNILRVVTAFTIGHSLTLLVGALGWIHLPGQLVEILIAFSILVSAVHAFRPIFPGKEIFLAAGFGLIHGLAFADTLANLNLDGGYMALSILGFNTGIELMQLVVIACVMPWLMMLSRFPVYTGVRIGGSVLAGIAAIGWMAERITGGSNFVTTAVAASVQYVPWAVFILAGYAAMVSARSGISIRR